jgi:drug/metabolite transporter (DMT)-like permease
MLAGLAVASIAVVLYGLAPVLQAVGSRAVATRSGRVPTARELIRERAWQVGTVLLCCGFGFFVLSTRLLPFLVAEPIRAAFLVVTVVCEHLVFRTRLRAPEILGATLAAAGLVLVVAGGGEKGPTDAVSAAAWTGAIAIAATLALGVPLKRVAAYLPRVAALAEAILSGVAFAVVDLGVRSLPSPLAVPAALASPTSWLAGVGALVGVVLLSRAAARISVGLATVVLTVVSVALASLAAAVLYDDTTNAGPARYGVATALAVVGLLLMAPARSGSMAARE